MSSQLEENQMHRDCHTDQTVNYDGYHSLAEVKQCYFTPGSLHQCELRNWIVIPLFPLLVLT